MTEPTRLELLETARNEPDPVVRRRAMAAYLLHTEMSELGDLATASDGNEVRLWGLTSLVWQRRPLPLLLRLLGPLDLALGHRGVLPTRPAGAGQTWKALSLQQRQMPK